MNYNYPNYPGTWSSPTVNYAPMNNAPGTWSPNQRQFTQQIRPQSNLLRVTGPESAKAYPIAPNDNVVLFDADNPIFYLVSSDDSGFKTMRTFRFEEEKPVEVQGSVEQMETSGFATKEDLDELKRDLSEIAKMVKELV